MTNTSLPAILHVSLPWADTLAPPPPHPGVTWSRRPVDWGLPAWRSRLQHVGTAVSLVWKKRRQGSILLCHAGIDVLVAAIAARLIARRTRVLVIDFLLPPILPRKLLRWPLRHIDHFFAIRSGDINLLHSLGVPVSRTEFIAFPAPPLTAGPDPTECGYVYSGGFAQRDWVTLAAALERSQVTAIVSCNDRCQRFPDNVQRLAQLRPEEGRQRLAHSKFLVQAIHETELPAGPLLILDAFSLGRPVVGSDVTATRDYIRHRENGLLVRPADASALAAAIAELSNDPVLLHKLAEGARRTAAELTSDKLWNRVFSVATAGTN